MSKPPSKWAGPSAHDRFWHKADMLKALTNVRIWGQSGHDQPLLTKLGLDKNAVALDLQQRNGGVG